MEDVVDDKKRNKFVLYLFVSIIFLVGVGLAVLTIFLVVSPISSVPEPSFTGDASTRGGEVLWWESYPQF